MTDDSLPPFDLPSVQRKKVCCASRCAVPAGGLADVIGLAAIDITARRALVGVFGGKTQVWRFTRLRRGGSAGRVNRGSGERQSPDYGPPGRSPPCGGPPGLWVDRLVRRHQLRSRRQPECGSSPVTDCPAAMSRALQNGISYPSSSETRSPCLLSQGQRHDDGHTLQSPGRQPAPQRLAPSPV